ncbi:MAG: NADH-quinone oxidoreductase subunit NuoH [Chloroflexota bacterium]|nr:NADH-quinone oxidoreductase subunit NuoH [Chloroflexota bacterium]MDE2696235.1 NADH-quinone oxidoreductase subunit NuoH [Chloroflexota bacterium]MXZ45440.1 NADH-quinone oxidoreductase subunit NuoH [Chloroflexota bacterium]MXZ63143.1 NADH-quinone oxidoreductase subunit NuoH [Chloroflexota bacterium]MYE31300.1 NADH-quinone oxidoreductase subunit NuoH [Chloroflexota bacterium]
MNVGLFGIENVNIWVDAFIRLQLIVVLMTVVVMGLIYGERKIIGRFQRRLGPMRTGPFGILQSLADALKLVGKEDLRPRGADPWVFELAVYFVFVPVFMAFVAVPFAFDWNVRVLELGLFYVVAISSINIVGWVMAGWASDNRYAMLGALRAAAQGISYELPLILSLIAVSMVVSTDAGRGSLDLGVIVAEQGHIPYIVWQPLAFAIFYVAMLAELNRTPFDIPVGESEVVGGPFVEYSGIRWSMFFLAEYAGLFILALVAAAVFLGGWAWPLGEELGTVWQLLLTAGKALLLIFSVFWVRVTMPRMRIDQLMGFSWKVLLPMSFALILVNGLILVYDWPDVVLLASNIVGLIALYLIVDRGITQRRVRPPARAGAATTA